MIFDDQNMHCVCINKITPIFIVGLVPGVNFLLYHIVFIGNIPYL